MTSMCRIAFATYDVTKELGCHEQRDRNSQVLEGTSDTSRRNNDCRKVSYQRAMLIDKIENRKYAKIDHNFKTKKFITINRIIYEYTRRQILPG